MGLTERLFQSNEQSNLRTRCPMNESRLPSEWLNALLRGLLGVRIYKRFVEPVVIDAQEEYWSGEAGNRWMARWVLVRCYGSILGPFLRALLSVLVLESADLKKSLGKGWLSTWLEAPSKSHLEYYIICIMRLMDEVRGTPTIRLTARSLETLRILQCEPRGAHGLDIVAKSDGLLSRASIYVVLGDLEEQGWVRAKRARKSGRLPRPRYSITTRGLAVLTEIHLTTDAVPATT
jgi:hypothetical protein